MEPEGLLLSREMRGEISPMIAEASTSTQSKWAVEDANSAEIRRRASFLERKPRPLDSFCQESGVRRWFAAGDVAPIVRADWKGSAAGGDKRPEAMNRAKPSHSDWPAYEPRVRPPTGRT